VTIDEILQTDATLDWKAEQLVLLAFKVKENSAEHELTAGQARDVLAAAQVFATLCLVQEEH
jgi:hypothetical protein